MAITNTQAEWLNSFNTDIVALLTLVEATLPHLTTSKNSPSIVTIGTIATRGKLVGTSPYGSIKAAVTHYTQTLAQDLAPKGIRVNMVTPGNIYSEDGNWAKAKKYMPEMYESVLKKSPMGRFGTVEEIGNSVVFLASSASSYTTGANLVVDGAYGPGLHL
jgi:3-oxoacyl-[acyl-carrier protein] reductase